jgi:hypothetical protein
MHGRAKRWGSCTFCISRHVRQLLLLFLMLLLLLFLLQGLQSSI